MTWQICLFWTFHINRIIKYSAYCNWLVLFGIIFLRFIHVIFTNNFYIYTILRYHILIIQSSVEENLVCFHLFVLVNVNHKCEHLWTLVYTLYHGRLILFLSSILLEVEFLQAFIFWGSIYLFSSAFPAFYIPISNAWVF